MGRVLFATSMDPFHLGHYETVTKFMRHHASVTVGLGTNPAKAGAGMFSIEERITLAELSLPAGVPVVRYEGPTMAFARSIGADILARSLRTGSDLDYEAELQFQNESIALDWDAEIETFFVLATENVKVSSTRVRELVALRAGSVALRRYLCPPAVDWIVDVYYARDASAGIA